MSTTLSKKNIIVGTDSQIQSRFQNDPEGTIYLSTSAPEASVEDVETSTDGTTYSSVVDSNGVAKIDLSPYLTQHQAMLYRPINVDGTQALANNDSTALNLAAGNNVTLTESNGTVTISASGGGGGTQKYLHKIKIHPMVWSASSAAILCDCVTDSATPLNGLYYKYNSTYSAALMSALTANGYVINGEPPAGNESSGTPLWTLFGTKTGATVLPLTTNSYILTDSPGEYGGMAFYFNTGSSATTGWYVISIQDASGSNDHDYTFWSVRNHQIALGQTYGGYVAVTDNVIPL